MKKLTLLTFIAATAGLVLLSSMIISTKRNTSNMHTPRLYPEVKSYLEQALNESAKINAERKKDLDALAGYITSNSISSLTFICTHNSRRSHMGQIWAAAAAAYYGLHHNVRTYSGGTEATAFNPRAVDALKRAGMQINVIEESSNPVYEVSYADFEAPLHCFSKIYSHDSNPKTEFAAVMTCSQADEACPLVAGAKARFSIPYEDPKKFDGTALEAAKYDERSLQIAAEMMYVMKKASGK